MPFGCYFRNGDNFLLNSPQGQVLNSFSDNYKLDHGISIKTINGQQYINVPNAFHSDGRGYFERAVNGTTRQVGSIENDAIRNIYGTFGNLAYQDSLTATGGKSVAQGAFARVIRDVNTIETYGTSFCPAQVEYYPNDRDGIVFDAGTVVPTGPENTVINTGRTPVIYLGV